MNLALLWAWLGLYELFRGTYVYGVRTGTMIWPQIIISMIWPQYRYLYLFPDPSADRFQYRTRGYWKRSALGLVGTRLYRYTYYCYRHRATARSATSVIRSSDLSGYPNFTADTSHCLQELQWGILTHESPALYMMSSRFGYR